MGRKLSRKQRAADRAEAAAFGAYLADPRVQGVLAAALLCMSDDVAKLDKEAAAHEAELATAELKDAYCTRQPAPAAMVNLRKPPPTLLPSVGQLSGNPGSWWEIVFDAAVLMGMAMVMMLLLGALAKC